MLFLDLSLKNERNCWITDVFKNLIRCQYSYCDYIIMTKNGSVFCKTVLVLRFLWRIFCNVFPSTWNMNFCWLIICLSLKWLQRDSNPQPLGKKTLKHLVKLAFFCIWVFFHDYRTLGEGARHFFISSLPLPPASQTLRH